MIRRVALSIVTSGLLALALAACGGSSNGVASKTPNQIVSAATNAVSNVKSVHVSGSISSSGSSFTLDLDLVKGKGAKGSMSQSGLSFQIVSVNREIYVNGGSAFWSHFAGASVAQLLTGKWLKAPASGQFAPLATFTDLHTLFTQLLSDHGTLAKGQTTSVRGQKVIPLNDTKNGGTLYVAATGEPYPIAIVKSGTNGGRVDFDRFNEPVTLTAPANAIDISQLG